MSNRASVVAVFHKAVRILVISTLGQIFWVESGNYVRVYVYVKLVLLIVIF